MPRTTSAADATAREKAAAMVRARAAAASLIDIGHLAGDDRAVEVRGRRPLVGRSAEPGGGESAPTPAGPFAATAAERES